MRRRLPIFCLLLAWFCANGAVWNIVQVVAWARMFRDYSQVLPATQALKLTFDGSAPCDLCQLAQSGQDTTRGAQSPAALGGSDKLLLAFQTTPAVVVTVPDFAWPGAADRAGPERTGSVPVPPPRV